MQLKTTTISSNNYHLLFESESQITGNQHFTLSNRYRYAFNGMEKDDEVKGTGNSYTTEFRQYDPRLGRWLSLDPKGNQMPWQSPYVSMDNNPILYNDILGDIVWSKSRFGRALRHEGGKVYKANGKEFKGKLRGIHKDAKNRLDKLSEKPIGKLVVSTAENLKKDIVIKRNKSSKAYGGTEGAVVTLSKEGKELPKGEGFIVLGHEIPHAIQQINGTINNETWLDSKDDSYDRDFAEIPASHIENMIRKEQGLSLRKNYFDSAVDPKGLSKITESNDDATYYDYNYSSEKSITGLSFSEKKELMNSVKSRQKK